MVLNSLFLGQQRRNRHREQSYGHGERGREGEMYGNSHYRILNKQPTEICCMAQETQTEALYQPRGVECRGRWEGG